MNYTSKEDYYNLSKANFKETGGDTLLQNYFNNSIAAVVAAAYPEHEFLPWKFSRTENHFWAASENRRQFLDWAATALNVKNGEDWYRISSADLVAVGGKALLALHGGSLARTIIGNYPEHNWSTERFNQK